MKQISNLTSVARSRQSSKLNPEEIRARAYAIFLANGAKHGHDVEDWVQAEAELLARSSVVSR